MPGPEDDASRKTGREAPKFGTSGLRGLVSELTDDLVAAHVAAFARACETGGRLIVGRDLRASSPRIAAAVLATGRAAELEVWDAGDLPTPALALLAAERSAAAIMVTGSHIPEDRNGLKFYTVRGEITKADEAAISATVAPDGARTKGAPDGARTKGAPDGARTKGAPNGAQAKGAPADMAPGDAPALDGRAPYRARTGAFGADALAGLRVGLYEHSTVARDVLGDVLRDLGAEVLPFGRSETFIPVDTEAVSDAMRADLAAFAEGRGLDAIVSADGDGDRPLLTDNTGRVVPGDVLGLVAARTLGADRVVTPVSSTTAIELSGMAAVRTRIGSPFVIAAMDALAGARVAGFEANGGFLLGWEAALPGGTLAPLLTRDAALPLAAALVAAKAAGGLGPLLAALPARHRAADRLRDVDLARTHALIAALTDDQAARAALLGRRETAMDLTDGLRLTYADGEIVHLRASGNAAELRCYAEAETSARAEALVAGTLDRVAARL